MSRTEFKDVWYRPDKNSWLNPNIIARRDIGTLTVNDDCVDFLGKKETVHLADIKGVSYTKQGKDLVNHWVKIEYGDGKTAYFADGSRLGWGGIFGGTKTIFEASRHLARS